MDDLVKLLKKFKAGYEFEMTNAECETEIEMDMPLTALVEDLPPTKMKMKITFKGDLKTRFSIGK